MKNRHTIYPYQYEKGKLMSGVIFWQILENANQTPTHNQPEPWKIKSMKYFIRSNFFSTMSPAHYIVLR
jgi:hypothetical protein